MNNIKVVLQRSELFADVDNSTLDKIAEIAYLKKFAKDEMLIRENSQAQELYIVTKGSFAALKSAAAENEIVHAQFSIFKPGMTVGELSFLDEQPRSADVVGLEDENEVIALPFNQLYPLASSKLYTKIAKQLSKNLRAGNDVIIQKLKQEIIHTKRMENMGRFITYVLLLMAFYDLALKGFVSLATNPYTSMFASTSVIFIFTLVLFIMIRRMGRPLAEVGLNVRHWQISVKESLFYTAIFLIFITFIKWVIYFPQPLFDMQAIVPNAKVGTSTFYIWLVSGMLVYGIFACFQEFISRGILQSSLEDFLQHKHKKLIANLVTSGVFSAMHIHLSAVLALLVFIPSFFWGWLYSRQRTLIGPIISHVIIGWWAIFGLGVQSVLQ